MKPGLEVDERRDALRIESFIKSVVDAASANGVVMGLSGGIDSAVVGALWVRALGKSRVLCLMLPSEHTPRADADDAHDLADMWDVRIENIPISAGVRFVLNASKVEGSRVAQANVQARIRMTILYYYANSMGLLVPGTGDRSEHLLNYYTKWGDGAADFLPIAHLYKTQVRELGAYLGIPARVVEKPSSPALWPDHRASDELPADYDKLDVTLHQLFDLGKSPSVAAKRAGVSRSVVDRVLEMNKKSGHKGRMPPALDPI